MQNPPQTAESPLNTNQNPFKRAGAVLFHGFAAALVVWCAWFITHLPWLAIPERVSLPVLLVLWLLSAATAGIGRPPGIALRTGTGSGLLTALLSLLILGTKITNPAPGFEALQPPILLTAAGFLTLGAAIGAAGALLGAALPASRPSAAPDYRARFAILTAVAIVPLLIIGGLVTSTNSGMAVPDWPNTFGSNMFLYPLGPRVAPDVYFEHSHRLFGAFVGLATLTLMIWVLLTDHRRWMRTVVVIAFVAVCIQGILGGIRVLEGSTELAEDNTLWRLVHGILAQLVFGLVVGIAAALTPTFRRLSPPSLAPVGPVASARPLRFFTTGFLHAMLLQLVLGAWFRHARSLHVLWTHAAFALIVLVFAIAAGFAAANVKHEHAGAGPIIRRAGRWIVAVVGLQFVLGWVTFGFGGLQHEPDDPVQALIRTAHQANGALTLALAVIAFVWVRRLLRNARATPHAESIPPPSP